jgi:hypothetical protein
MTSHFERKYGKVLQHPRKEENHGSKINENVLD